MIASLVKELFRAVPRYLTYRARLLFHRQAPTPAGLSAPGAMAARQAADAAHEPALYRPAHDFDWSILSQPPHVVYEGGPAASVMDLLSFEPRFALDVGCGNGSFGARFKERFPKAKIWGVEPNERAAQEASARVDHVLLKPVGDVDWNREGVKRGEIDTVFLFDVLEHIYDPWQTLLDLRNLVSERAQLLASIPNVRNLFLLQDLVSGYWRYGPAGLLDITHIRFFTEKDMHRMFYQTGYRVLASTFTLCPRTLPVLEKYRLGPFPVTIELKSATITAHSHEDLTSLCALQHVFLLQPVALSELTAKERAWIDEPHPETAAFRAEPAPIEAARP